MDYKETTVREGTEKEEPKAVVHMCAPRKQSTVVALPSAFWPDGEALAYLNALDHPQFERLLEGQVDTGVFILSSTHP